MTIDLSAVGATICDPRTYQRDEWAPLFARLRRRDPVHYVRDSAFGPHWAITRYHDIKEIEANPGTFSSDYRHGGVTPFDVPEEFVIKSFFMMDPPEHTAVRDVLKVLGFPAGVAPFEELIRTTTREVLDGLPRGEVFDWVDRVSVEITSTMLAALMDYPIEQRRDLVYWSDVVTAFVDDPDSPISSEEEREAEKRTFAARMMTLWEDRAHRPVADNLISLLAGNDRTKDMPERERMDTLVTFLVGGNDTTRNTMSGGLCALWDNPAELEKLRTRPALLPSFVQESLRWQTPSMNMRRTARADCDFRGKRIRQGDKLVLWYLSANRDEEVIDRPDEFIVDRARPTRHLAFGHGIHRCLGARLSELQLTILWQEFLARELQFEVVGRPDYVYSAIMRAIRSLPVRLT